MESGEVSGGKFESGLASREVDIFGTSVNLPDTLREFVRNVRNHPIFNDEEETNIAHIHKGCLFQSSSSIAESPSHV